MGGSVHGSASASTAGRLGRRPVVVALAMVGLALPGCTTGAAPGSLQPARPSAPSASPSEPAPAPTVGLPTASSSPTASSPTVGPVPSGDRGPGPDGVRITAPPPGVEPVGPVVVLVHGGAWVGGSPSLLDGWADALAAEGAVVFNASYVLVGDPGGGYPGSVEDVACAVRFARTAAPAYTESDELVLVGHSAGGHLGAVVALDPERWAADCAYPPAAPPDRLVGLAGIYDVKSLVVSFLFSPFVRGTTIEPVARWGPVNPVELAAGQDALDVVLVTGADDRLVPPSQALAFAAALPDGAESREIAGADHFELQDPNVVGVDAILGK